MVASGRYFYESLSDPHAPSFCILEQCDAAGDQVAKVGTLIKKP